MTQPTGAAVPDVLGLTLPDAEAELAARSLRARVEETKPPGAGQGDGAARVVRQGMQDGDVLLTVTRERYAAPDERGRRRPDAP